jgi:hypothetical protein
MMILFLTRIGCFYMIFRLPARYESADDPPVYLCGGRDARSPLGRLDDPPTELFKTNIGGMS